MWTPDEQNVQNKWRQQQKQQPNLFPNTFGRGLNYWAQLRNEIFSFHFLFLFLLFFSRQLMFDDDDKFYFQPKSSPV